MIAITTRSSMRVNLRPCRGGVQESPAGFDCETFDRREAVTADRRGEILHGAFPFCCIHWIPVYFRI